MIDPAEIQEARLLIRYVAMELTPGEREAITAWLADTTDRQAGQEAGVSCVTVLNYRRRALAKMRLAFKRLGITSTADLLSKK